MTNEELIEINESLKNANLDYRNDCIAQRVEIYELKRTVEILEVANEFKTLMDAAKEIITLRDRIENYGTIEIKTRHELYKVESERDMYRNEMCVLGNTLEGEALETLRKIIAKSRKDV